VRKGDAGGVEQALAAALARFLLLGQGQIEHLGPGLPFLQRFERLPLAGGSDEPLRLLAGGLGLGAIGHALEGGGKILADLPGHKAKFPAGAVNGPGPLVREKHITRSKYVHTRSILARGRKTKKPTVGF
jgi:hypothetical protein